MDRGKAEDLAAGAHGVLNLNGDTYLISQPTLGDFATLRRWVKKRIKTPLQEALEATRGQPREVLEIVLGPMVQKHLEQSHQREPKPVSAEAIDEAIGSPEGCAFLLWLLARRNHPGVTPATFRPHLDEENVDVVLADLLDASGMLDLDPNSLAGASGSSTGSPAA